MASSATRQRSRERVTIHEIAEQKTTMIVGTSTMSSTVFHAAPKSALSKTIWVYRSNEMTDSAWRDGACTYGSKDTQKSANKGKTKASKKYAPSNPQATSHQRPSSTGRGW